MARTDIELIRDIATAVLWRIDDQVAEGVPFEDAKESAIKTASRSWVALPADTREALHDVCQSIGPPDLSARTIGAVRARFADAIAKARGRPMGLIERMFFALTGRTF